jgi:hypothetical protein
VGSFAVYRDGEMIAEFAIDGSMLARQYRPAELMVTAEELVDLAKAAVAGDYASDEDLAAFMAEQAMNGRHLPSQN